MKTFCISLTEHAADAINFKKNNKMLLLTEIELKSHQGANQCYICRKKNYPKTC